MNITAVGIDLAKNVFHVHGVDERGGVVIKKKLNRNQILDFVRNLPQTLIGLEACGGAHYWGREFRACGHEVRMMAPQFVKPYVKANKNDMADAEAICEAVTRPNMRFVGIKEVEQQEVLMIHRIRSRLVRQRTALSNEIRGLLMEFGVTIPQGIWSVKKFLKEEEFECKGKVTAFAVRAFKELKEEFFEINRRVEGHDKTINQMAKSHPICVQLMTIPGVGPITATAAMASVGEAKHFKNGRQFAAWLGLVPRQNSTGGKQRLLGISKRGDKYLRALLIHGARAVSRYATAKTDRLSVWVAKLMEKKGVNKASVAYANKIARAMWVILSGKDNAYKTFEVVQSS